MHLLYLIDELSVSSGTEKHLLFLAKSMVSLGYRVTVFSLTDGPFAKNFHNSKSRGIKYFCVNVRRIYDLKGIVALKIIYNYIKKEKVDILQSFHTGSDIIGPILTKITNCGAISISSRRDTGFTKLKRHLIAQKILNFNVKAIIANSNSVKKSVILQEKYPQDQIVIIHNGVENKALQSKLDFPYYFKDIFKNSKKPFIVGSAGNLTQQKGHDFLLDVANKILKKYKEIYFVIAGDGPLKKYLKTKCQKLGIANRIKFIGNIENIDDFYKSLDVYVQPSKSEGFSNSILEAMAFGLVVIATNVGGNAEAIEDGDTGFLIKYNDVERLVKKIEYLYHNEFAKNKMGLKAKKRTEQLFNVEIMLKKYDLLYRNLKTNSK